MAAFLLPLLSAFAEVAFLAFLPAVNPEAETTLTIVFGIYSCAVFLRDIRCVYPHKKPPFLPNDHIQDLFRKRDDDPASQGQKAVCPLAWVMGLQRQPDLHDAKSQQYQSDGPDQAEDKIGQIVDCRDWISRRIADTCADGET